MDLKVYQKELVKQPQGDMEVLKTDIIDIYPQFDESGDILKGADICEGRVEIEQEMAMATIYQRGQDPVEKDDGIQWSELLLGELSALQIIAQIQEAVRSVSTTATVSFSTIKDITGQERLAFTINAI